MAVGGWRLVVEALGSLRSGLCCEGAVWAVLGADLQGAWWGVGDTVRGGGGGWRRGGFPGKELGVKLVFGM